MSRVRFWAVLGLFGVVCLFVPVAQSQPGGGVTIKGKAAPPEPIADTKLIMDGLASANLRGLGKLLREKPADAEAWAFARGQALIIAETGNLLLIRPPRTGSQDLWLGHAGDMRDAAEKLARVAVAKDYAKSRAGLAHLANTCNRCHQAFQVPTRVDPFADE